MTRMTDVLTAAAARFASNTANHEMTVLHDDGLYRHLRFKAPDTGFYWFDLVTWPGHLAFVGDMPGFVFARVPDMFAFFRPGGGINPTYWAEKIVTGREGVKTYSEDRFRQHVAECVNEVADDWPGLREAVQRDVLDDPDIYYDQGARQALDAFRFVPDPGRFGEFRFEDTWEWDLTDWDPAFLWCCHAIRWGIDWYDAARKASVR